MTSHYDYSARWTPLLFYLPVGLLAPFFGFPADDFPGHFSAEPSVGFSASGVTAGAAAAAVAAADAAVAAAAAATNSFSSRVMSFLMPSMYSHSFANPGSSKTRMLFFTKFCDSIFSRETQGSMKKGVR